MSRVIKFRAWNKEESRMIDLNGFEIAFKGMQKEGEVTAAIEQGNIYMYDADDVEIMQFTGLTDKDGVDIYEGDIVKSDYYEPEFRELAVIGYDEFEMRFCFNNQFGDLNGEQDAFKYGNLEVISNIHQNPELLK
ncbi:putative ORF029 [Vibrio phage 120E34-1]|nr:putative ORF029 [Vibrio phage 120E34-1]